MSEILSRRLRMGGRGTEGGTVVEYEVKYDDGGYCCHYRSVHREDGRRSGKEERA